jgi:4-aminobutyrate aminotransferase/(S)-3-amino-2-methylpropionate transaminase
VCAACSTPRGGFTCHVDRRADDLHDNGFRCARRRQAPICPDKIPEWRLIPKLGLFSYNVDGNVLIDLGSGIAVTSVGASAPEVVAAVAAQAADFTHTCFMVSPYESYVAVCEALARLTPGDHEKRSVLVNSGAEAVENAVKIARRATGRDAVIVLDHAYHGRTNLTMAMTAKAMPYKAGFGPFAGAVYRVPASYPLRDPEGMTGEQAAQRHQGYCARS